MQKWFTIGLICSFSFLFSEDWPSFRGDRYDGISKEKLDNNKIKNGLKELWTANVGTGYSAVVVSAGKAYTIGNSNSEDILFCFDAKTGKELWKASYPAPLENKMYEGGPNATPTVANGRVYAFSKNGHILGYDAKTGKELWTRNLKKEGDYKKPGWGFSGSPLVYENKIIINMGDSGIALSEKDGSVLWKSARNDSGYSSPIPYTLGGKKSLLIFCGDALKNVDPANGKVNWSFNWPTKYNVNASQPIVDVKTQHVFISSGYDDIGGTVLDISGKEPKQIWKNSRMRNKMNSCVLIDGYIYGFDGQSKGRGELKCLDFKTGEEKWKVGNFGLGTIVAMDKTLVGLSEGGELMIFESDSSSFKKIWSKKVLDKQCWTAPTISNGVIYVRDASGVVKALVQE